MRVLHVQETLAPNFGGPAKVLPELAVEQRRAGLDVEILTTNADTPRGTYHPVGCKQLLGSDVAVTYCAVGPDIMRFSWEVRDFLRRRARDFDIIHVHGLYRFPQSYAAYYARKNGIPYIIRPHGSLDPYLFARSSRSLTLKRLYERIVDIPNLHAASAIHYTTSDERDLVSFMKLRAPGFVVPNGLAPESYETLPERGALRARFGLDERPVVLFLGRLHRKKGLDILVDAFALTLRSVPSAQLVVAGPEPDDTGAEIRRQIEKRGVKASVLFTGPLFGADVVQAYVDADVFALSSYTENFGMSVVEAMACGSPVVISDRVNIHSEVAGADAGVVTRCDAEEVAQALSTLLADEKLRRDYGAAGRRLVRERFTWPAIVESLSREYEAILARHPAR